MKETKSKIYKLLENIDDETVLNQVMEEVVFYTAKKDVIDNLTSTQIAELDIAIKEADTDETISWAAFKTDINEWRSK